jgi:hypothetical protein
VKDLTCKSGKGQTASAFVSASVVGQPHCFAANRKRIRSKFAFLANSTLRAGTRVASSAALSKFEAKRQYCFPARHILPGLKLRFPWARLNGHGYQKLNNAEAIIIRAESSIRVCVFSDKSRPGCPPKTPRWRTRRLPTCGAGGCR